jgi:hypothetical protein
MGGAAVAGDGEGTSHGVSHRGVPSVALRAQTDPPPSPPPPALTLPLLATKRTLSVSSRTGVTAMGCPTRVDHDAGWEGGGEDGG